MYYKMTTPRSYKKYVVGRHYRLGLVQLPHERQTRDSWPFKPSDRPEKWNMIHFNSDEHFWKAGYIYRGLAAYQLNPDRIGFTQDYYLTRKHPPLKYWWCRDGDWLPFWGIATKQRSDLVKEIRSFWRNKWFCDMIPNIKKALIDSTPLPKDVVEFVLPEYFEYPYQTKNV